LSGALPCRPQQLRLAAEPLQPARRAVARSLDALQALLAALADRDQLGLDLAAALDRKTDGIGLSASGHGSVHVSIRSAKSGEASQLGRAAMTE
jgi:hypothetical protein